MAKKRGGHSPGETRILRKSRRAGENLGKCVRNVVSGQKKII